MSEKIYTLHTDPGHGWLEVPKAELPKDLRVSAYSYQDEKGNVYLEEDCDAWAFLQVMGLDLEKNVRVIHCNHSHWIRNMRGFSQPGKDTTEPNGFAYADGLSA